MGIGQVPAECRPRYCLGISLTLTGSRPVSAGYRLLGIGRWVSAAGYQPLGIGWLRDMHQTGIGRANVKIWQMQNQGLQGMGKTYDIILLRSDLAIE